MKKSLRYLLVCATILSIAIGIMAYRYYGYATERTPYDCLQHHDDTLRVAVIGDSWAFFHHEHDASLANMLSSQTGRAVKVKTYGICGLTSKEVYQSFFDDEAMRLLLEDGADYCFVSVGINDTYKKIGAGYYVYHTLCIVRFLLHNHITPILLEIPVYDIQYAYEHQTFDRKLLRQLSMLVTSSPLDCRDTYRQSLRQTLDQEGLTQKVIIIDNHQWDMSLYRPDRMHLNEQGYMVLDSCMTSEILR